MVSVSISFRLSSEERQAIEAVADMLGVSISDVLRDAIREYLKNLKKDEKLQEDIQRTAIWQKYRKETQDVMKQKLWYWNAYKLIKRLKEEGVPQETISEISKEIGERMKEFDPQQAEKFRRLLLGMGVK